MVAIRLSRVGKKNHATFRIIVSDRRKDTLGSYLELLGSYDPHQTPTRLEIKEDRAKYWLSVGAKPSVTVHNLFVEKGILPGPKLVVAQAKKMATEDTAAPTAPAADAAATTPAAETPAEAPAEPPKEEPTKE